MLFFSFSNAVIQFIKTEITRRRYIIANALLMTQKMKLIDKKEFAPAILNTNNKTFVMYVAALNIRGTNIAIHSFWVAQIELLKANKAFTTVSAKYSHYTNIFILEIAAELLKYTDINNYTFELEKSK